jgi:hypothetical protein
MDLERYGKGKHLPQMWKITLRSYESVNGEAVHLSLIVELGL